MGVDNAFLPPIKEAKPVVYIAGKVTGLDYDETVTKFGTKAAELRAAGFDVVNPMEIVPKEATWQEAMKICVAKLIHVDYLVLLPDWTNSNGAILEYRLAWSLGIDVLKPKDKKGLCY